MIETKEELMIWNDILYGTEYPSKELGAQWFFDNFGIKSAPLFRDECYYHIPQKWGSVVKDLILDLQFMYKDKIKFIQIKEKFCELIIYAEYDEQIKNEAREHIFKAKQKLFDLDLYPFKPIKK